MAVNDSYTTPAGTTLTETPAQGVLANDTDAGGAKLTAKLVTQPADGTLTLNADGSFTYAPAAGFQGSDSFTYEAFNGTNLSAPATVALTVTPTPTPTPTPTATPVPPKGSLAAVGSIGSVGGTPVTSNNTPTFSGSATAGDVVAIMAQSDGSSTPVQVGQTTAASNGSWSASTNKLNDGGYTFYVKSFSPLNPNFTAQTAPMGRVVIETSGPRVSNITYNAKQGVFDITYTDNVGLNLGSLFNTAGYTLTQKNKTIFPTAFGVVGGNGTTTETIAVAFKGAKKLKIGKQSLTINAGLEHNAAGEILDGEFRGALPSGNGAPGGNFQAVFNVNGRRKAKGPLPAAVTVASVTPKNTAARVFAAGVSSRTPKAVHSDIFVPVHISKKQSHKH